MICFYISSWTMNDQKVECMYQHDIKKAEMTTSWMELSPTDTTMAGMCSSCLPWLKAVWNHISHLLTVGYKQWSSSWTKSSGASFCLIQSWIVYGNEHVNMGHVCLWGGRSTLACGLKISMWCANLDALSQKGGVVRAGQYIWGHAPQNLPHSVSVGI